MSYKDIYNEWIESSYFDEDTKVDEMSLVLDMLDKAKAKFLKR